MRLLDALLNVVTVVAVTVVLAYLGLHFDTGLFTILPQEVTGFFLAHRLLFVVALVVLVGALLAKIPVGRSIKRQRGRSRV